MIIKINKTNKNKKRHDLLEMPEAERIKFIKEIREKLQSKIVEAKLWQSLIEAEDLKLNGITIKESDIFGNGLTISK